VYWLQLADITAAEWASYGGLGTIMLVVIAVFVRSRGAKKRRLDFSNPQERLRYALTSGKQSFWKKFSSTFSRAINEEAMGALEQILVEADIGIGTSEQLVKDCQAAFKAGKFKKQEELLEFLKAELKKRLGGDTPKLGKASSGPTVILMVGVNGVGKTTSISKLASHLAEQGHKVLLSASDTFRAAAVDQLAKWAERLDLEIVRGQPRQKPDAVAYDAAEKALAKNFDYLIVDTAGRLHTQKNLMKELSKISRVLGEKIDGAPHETLLVIDANTGQNAVVQTDKFGEATNITGVFLTKLDGTPKGGIVVRIKEELSVPVKFVGLGEKPEDIAAFDANTFVDALFA
jgi:fused signal recognition particle receptor